MTKSEYCWGIHTGESVARKKPQPGYFSAKPSPV